MTYDEALEKAVEEGAVRVYRMSDSMAFAYRVNGGHIEARGMYAKEDNWELGDYLVSAENYAKAGGWYRVHHLPKQAKLIESEAARKNSGYSQAVYQQCYTCKEYKALTAFDRPEIPGGVRRNWECNECYERRTREAAAYGEAGEIRAGDYLDKETMASPPPPEGQI